MALDKRQILNLVGNELSQAAGGNENDFIDSNRQTALAYYLGQPDGKEVEGRSTIISTDVADAIEWIMPEIIKAFTQNNEVVTFDAVSSKDERQANLESRYVYDILMKDNNGFIIIHQFVKDALMQKNGFLKVYYETDEQTVIETYTGINDIELESLFSDDTWELKELTTEIVDDINIHDVKVERIESKSKVNVVSVPPEEFRINRQHNSVDVSGARFSAHVLLKVAGDLVTEGYDKAFVDTIPTSEVYEDDREYRFYMQDETVYPDRDAGMDASLRTIEVAECFMHIDIDEDGVAEYVKVTVAGGDNPDVLLSVETLDSSPFISATAILMSHKLFGLSIYDRLKQIQDQKTSLWRNIFDNMYLQNNQRTIVVENQVNLDDLLVSRPGGIIRTKTLGAVAPYVTPPLPADAYKMMDYLDQVRSGRTGVSPEGAVTDSMIGDRVGSEGIANMMSAKEELVGLMVRVFAETGIKPLCYKIRDEAIKHQDTMKEYKFRGEWVDVNPTKWRERLHSTVRVGTGSGNRKQQQATITQLMLIQEKMLQNPQQAMVVESKIFKAIDDYTKFSGMSGAEAYFLDPESPEGKHNREKVNQAAEAAKKEDQQVKMMELDFQTKIAAAETSKADTAAKNVDLKAQVDQGKNVIAAQKERNATETAGLKQRLAEAEALISSDEKDAELVFKYWEVKERTKVELERIAATAKAAKDNNKDSYNA